MHKITFVLVLLLLASFASGAIEVNTDKNEYSPSEVVTITISCEGSLSTIELFNSNNRPVYFKGGSNSWTTGYNTASDPTTGIYTLNGNCEDGTTDEKQFCVGQNGCLDTTSGTVVTETRSSSSGSGRSSGGGGSICVAQWQCGQWGLCNATLQQERTCTDLKNCRQKPRVEAQSCPVCEESWTCTSWSECNGGTQTRTCTDQHQCGTVTRKPLERQSCTPPSSQLPNQQYQQSQQIASLPPQQPQVQQPSFMEKYKNWLIIIGAGVIFVALLSSLLWYFTHRHHQIGYNVDELKNWIKQEQAMGTSNDDITQILMERTGWNKEEIGHAFQSLSSKSQSLGNPSQLAKV